MGDIAELGFKTLFTTVSNKGIKGPVAGNLALHACQHLSDGVVAERAASTNFREALPEKEGCSRGRAGGQQGLQVTWNKGVVVGNQEAGIAGGWVRRRRRRSQKRARLIAHIVELSIGLRSVKQVMLNPGEGVIALKRHNHVVQSARIVGA